jgi:hypothetical protein
VHASTPVLGLRHHIRDHKMSLHLTGRHLLRRRATWTLRSREEFALERSPPVLEHRHEVLQSQNASATFGSPLVVKAWRLSPAIPERVCALRVATRSGTKRPSVAITTRVCIVRAAARLEATNQVLRSRKELEFCGSAPLLDLDARFSDQRMSSYFAGRNLF